MNNKSKKIAQDRKRRIFMQNLLKFWGVITVSGIAPLSFAFADDLKSEDESDIWDCIVLGAGMSGVTAAREIIEASAHNLYISEGQKGKRIPRVLVLEAANYIGGRVKTNYEFSEGRAVEMGAEYIHRAENSVPLWTEVKNFGFLADKVPKLGGGFLYDVNLEGGLQSMNSAVINLGLDVTSGILNGVLSYKGKDINPKMWLEQYGKDYSAVARDFAEMMLLGHLPGNLDNLSVRGFGIDNYIDQLNEPLDFSLEVGNTQIIKGIAAKIAEQNIRLNTPIAEIIIGADQQVTIVTQAGEKLKAKTAVCTFSAGVLKSGKVKFKAESTEVGKALDLKMLALERIGMGPISKFTLEFTEQFWPKTMSMVHNISHDRQGGRTYFNMFQEIKNAPPSITAFFVGPDAAKMHPLSDNEAIERILHDLKLMYPAAAPTMALRTGADGKPRLLRQEWQKEPFVLGGYTFLQYKDSHPIELNQARRILADTSTAPLFWAGEATSFNTQPSSMHGAHNSGLRVASEVRNYLNGTVGLTQDEMVKKFKEWVEAQAEDVPEF